MAVRRRVRKLSSKCAIDTPTTCLVFDVASLQAGFAISVARTASPPSIRTINRNTVPPSRVRPTMSIAIGHDRGHDDTALDDVLDVGVEADECKPARHDAENHRADDRAADASNASREAGPADHCGSNRVELVRHAHPGLSARRTCRGDDPSETREQSSRRVDIYQMLAHVDARY